MKATGKAPILATLTAVALLANPLSISSAGVGDVIAVIMPQPGAVSNFCSIGLAFDGQDLFFDRCSDPLIYRISTADGSNLGSFDPGIPELPNAMAFDAKRNGLWIGCQGCNGTGMPIYFYDFTTATSTLKFTIPFGLINPATGETFLGFCFNDGLAYNENGATDADDEIYFSDDVNRNLGLFRPDGTLVMGFDSSTIDGSLSTQSGLAVGGANLYLGNNGGGDVFRAALPAFSLVDQFVSANERQEDMECDPITFAPIEVMWVRTTPQGGQFPDVITAFEIEPNTCGVGGGGQMCYTLDFETEDDFSTPLVNGQHINTEFGPLVSITSSGPNAGAGIFDSTDGGPNDPSQDLDLLASTGNILILQTENFPPDVNDIFPRPNDDEDGGTLTFAFTSPVEAMSVRLLDVDASDGPSSVVLTDGAGKKRTYTVPGNWTGDLNLSQPGQGTLDLTILTPQAGFGSMATASEDAGFDPMGVMQLDLHLGGSAGVDDLSVCTGGAMLQASATPRYGSNVNPHSLANVATPVIGGTWGAHLDCRAHSSGLALLLVTASPASGPTLVFGELLVSGTRYFRTTSPHTGSVVAVTRNVPNDTSLIGLAACVQGLCTGAPGSQLSNAVDLVLGF